MHEIEISAWKEWFIKSQKNNSFKELIDTLTKNISLETDENVKLRLASAVNELRKSKIEDFADFEDWFMKIYYNRDYEGEYIVGFLDILGFKELLKANKIGVIRRSFETIADSIYSRRRMSFLNGIPEPTIVNFSDSIIIYNKIFKSKKSNIINSFLCSEFISTINQLVSSLLIKNIAIRGGVSIGKLYNEVIQSYSVKNVSRQPIIPIIHEDIIDEGLITDEKYQEWQNGILPPITIPIHFGDSLTESYLLESEINSIGVFMETHHFENELIGDILRHERSMSNLQLIRLEEKEFIYFNWCRAIHFEDYLKVQKIISSNINYYKHNIKNKWISLNELTQKLKKR